jgi:hypothetical protein
MTTMVTLLLLLGSPQDSLRRDLVLQLMPRLVETAVANVRGETNTGSHADVFLPSFTVLASAAVGEDLDSGTVGRALGRDIGRKTPSDVFSCRRANNAVGEECRLPPALYLELVGLLVSPLNAEATIVMAWPGPTSVTGLPRTAVRTIRLQFRRDGGRWNVTNTTVLGES